MRAEGSLRSLRIISVFSAALHYCTAESHFCIVLLHLTIDGTKFLLRAEGSLRSFRIISVFSASLRYRIDE